MKVAFFKPGRNVYSVIEFTELDYNKNTREAMFSRHPLEDHLYISMSKEVYYKLLDYMAEHNLIFGGSYGDYEYVAY